MATMRSVRCGHKRRRQRGSPPRYRLQFIIRQEPRGATAHGGEKPPMPTDVVMPQMGESIFEGTITKWLKKTGDAVQKDEPLFEISTDKVDAEIPRRSGGRSGGD